MLKRIASLCFVHLPLVWWKVEEWLGMQWMAGFSVHACMSWCYCLPGWSKGNPGCYFNWIDKLVLHVNFWQVNCTFTDWLSFIFLNIKHASPKIYEVFPHILNEFNKYLNMLKVLHVSYSISIQLLTWGRSAVDSWHSQKKKLLGHDFT